MCSCWDELAIASHRLKMTSLLSFSTTETRLRIFLVTATVLHLVAALRQCVGDLRVGERKGLAFFLGLGLFDVLGGIVEDGDVVLFVHSILCSMRPCGYFCTNSPVCRRFMPAS